RRQQDVLRELNSAQTSAWFLNSNAGASPFWLAARAETAAARPPQGEEQILRKFRLILRRVRSTRLEALRAPKERRPGPCIHPIRSGDLASARHLDPLLDQGVEAVLRHGLREQVALPEIAAHAEQAVGVRRLLDADRDGDRLEIVREVDDGLADGGVLLVGGAVGDERAVELELGERH